MTHFQVHQQVHVHRGTYEGCTGKILKFTEKQVKLCLSDGRHVRIAQKSLEPRPEPSPRQYLPIPTLSRGQRVYIHRGTYKGDYGEVLKLTTCKVHLSLENQTKHVLINKTSVQPISDSQSVSQQQQNRSFSQVQQNSDFTVPTSNRGTRSSVNRQEMSRVVTPTRSGTHRSRSSASTRTTDSSPAVRERPRVVTPPPMESAAHVPARRQGAVSTTSSRSTPRSVRANQGTQHVPRSGPRVRRPSTHVIPFGTRNVDLSSPSFANLRMVLLNQSGSIASNTRRSARERIARTLPCSVVQDPTTLPGHCRSCAICVENFRRGDSIKRLPCMHGFHSSCIDEWIPRRPTCPLCNHRLTNDVSLH